MLSSIPSQYHVYIGIGGLTFLMLFMSSLAQKFQAYQLEKEAALRRMVRGIQQVENLLNLLDGCAVSKKIFILLRKEILARYLVIRQLHKNYSNIGLSIQTAQRNVEAAEAKAEMRRITPVDQVTLSRFVKGLTQLIAFLKTEGHIAGMSEIERKHYQTELGVLRADYVYDFHATAGKKYAAANQWDEAGKSFREISQFLQTHGPSNEHVKDLFQKTNNYARAVVAKKMPDDASVEHSEFDQQQNVPSDETNTNQNENA